MIHCHTEIRKLFMRKIFSATLIVLLLGCMSAAAQFEGAIEMKTTVNGPDGSSRGIGGQKVFLSAAGSRMELEQA